MNFTKTAYTVSLLIVGLGLAVNAYSQSFPTNGLVAYYPFNGNANDQTTNANNGTVHNAVLTTDRFNQANSAYAFNGANAYISAPNQSYLTFPSGGDFTISLWASFAQLPGTSWPASWKPMVGIDNGTGANPKWILAYGQLALPAPVGYSSNYVHFETGGSSPTTGYWLACTLYTPTVGVWQNYLVTKAGTTYTMYIDGVAATGTTNYYYDGLLHTGVTGPSSVSSGITAPLTFGWTEGSAFFNGNLDDIRIYSRALSTNEIQQLYAYESRKPIVTLKKAVEPSFSNLIVGTNYQLQISTSLSGTFTNYGSVFTATNTSMVYPQYFDVDNWNSLFFQLKTSP